MGWVDTVWRVYKLENVSNICFFDSFAMDSKQKTKTNIIGIDSYNDFWHLEDEKTRARWKIFWNGETPQISLHLKLHLYAIK